VVALLVLSCAATFRGVVDTGPPVRLLAPAGPSVRLVLEGDHTALGRLDGFSVDASGPRLLGRIWVRNWTVVAAEDGSAPYVGPLRVTGQKLMVEDAGSGQIVEVVGAEGLAAHADLRVLVVGYVVAPQVVQVMRWELLEAR